MGVRTSETFWAVRTSKRQVINLRNRCIWLADLFEKILEQLRFINVKRVRHWSGMEGVRFVHKIGLGTSICGYNIARKILKCVHAVGKKSKFLVFLGGRRYQVWISVSDLKNGYYKLSVLVSEIPASQTQGQCILTVHSHSCSNLPHKLQ